MVDGDLFGTRRAAGLAPDADLAAAGFEPGANSDAIGFLMPLTEDGLDSASWNFIRKCASASQARDQEAFVKAFQKLDGLTGDNKVLPYLTYTVSQQLWHLTPDGLSRERIREMSEATYPDLSNMAYVDIDGLEKLFLAVFGKSSYRSEVGDVTFVGLLAIALGLLCAGVDEDMARIRPRLADWCKRAQAVESHR